MKIIKCNLPAVFSGIIIFSSLALCNSCAGLDQFEKQVLPEPAIINNALPFIDVPVPNGCNRDQSKSFVYETGNNDMKVGRLFFNGSSGLKPTVEFYQNEMVNKGWTLVSSMASSDTILNYQKEGWTCTVIIRPRSFSRSNVEVQIGPVQVGSK